MPNIIKRPIVRPRFVIGEREQRKDVAELGVVEGRKFPGIIPSPINIPQHPKVIAPEEQAEEGHPYQHLPPISLIPTKTVDNYGSEIENLSAGSRAPIDGPWPVTTYASTSTHLKWLYKVRHIIVQNNTTVSIYIDFDSPASLGSLLVPSGAYFDADMSIRAIDIYTVAAQNINQPVTSNIYVVGFQ